MLSSRAMASRNQNGDDVKRIAEGDAPNQARRCFTIFLQAFAYALSIDMTYVFGRWT